MQDFEYAAPRTVDEAVQLLAQHGEQASLLAGGTDILVQLREGQRSTSLVVDVKQIPDLFQVDWGEQRGLRLGAAAACWQVYEDDGIASAYPALADATRIIGGWQIQSRASVGGNLCNASPAADSIPPLIVHGATCLVAGSAGVREIPAAEFCVAPGVSSLERGELLVALKLPAPVPQSSSAYLRFIPRNEMDIAVAGAASWVQLSDDGEVIQSAKIALSAVGPTPLVADEAAQWLPGRTADSEAYEQAGQLAKKVADPISDMRGTAIYRTHLVGVLVKRSLAIAVDRARRSG